MKTCKRCGESKPLSMFGPHKHTRDKLNTICKPCGVQRTLAWARANPGRPRPPDLPSYRRHGLSDEDFQTLVVRQHGVCAVCAQPPRDGQRLVVDHDHGCCPRLWSCGICVRGLLCHGCNQAAGILDDSPILAIRVADYLERPWFRARRVISD